MYKLLRRGTGRMFVFCIVIVSLLLCLYYVSQIQTPSSGQSPSLLTAVGARYERPTTIQPDYSEAPDVRVSMTTCPLIRPRTTDIETQEEYQKFDFQVSYKLTRKKKIHVYFYLFIYLFIRVLSEV